MAIVTHPANKNYRSNFDETFGRKPKTEPTSDLSLLPDKAHTHAAYASFVKEMQGRQYGDEALNDAWLWFATGWDARS
jgi:hypothetical protein